MHDVFQDVSKSQVRCVKVFKYCVPCSFVENYRVFLKYNIIALLV